MVDKSALAQHRKSTVFISPDRMIARVLSDDSLDEVVETTKKGLSTDWENVLSSRRRLSSHVGLDMTMAGEQLPADHLENREKTTFITDSSYTGQWNNVGMCGEGTYVMPHNVEYNGEMRDGMFHGDGSLTYPCGSKLIGVWSAGKMMTCRYQFGDKLTFQDPPWNYCVVPDRRFRIEHVDGLKPAGRSYKTQQVPTRVIPPGCYDTGDGFFNPKTKCITCPKTGVLIRIPTKEQETWIVENCRRAWDNNCGYRPDLYENWFKPKLSQKEKESKDHFAESGDKLNFGASETFEFDDYEWDSMFKNDQDGGSNGSDGSDGSYENGGSDKSGESGSTES